MIWVAGRIVRDEELSISVLDRSFEHGLGLFETLRTWNGKAVLLSKHLDRLRDSALVLGLPLDPTALPNQDAVEALLRAERADGDVVLRITMSGGLSPRGAGLIWMRTLPLPPPARHEGAVVTIGEWSVLRGDRLARHKVLNYWGRRSAHESARELGFDEAISIAPDGTLWEGSRTNLFLLAGDTVITPTKSGPIVPGIMRDLLLVLARDLPLTVRQDDTVTPDILFEADEVFLTNSVRGIIPVSSAHYFGAWPATPRRWPAPGPWTQRLSLLLADRLDSQGGKPA
ncbi:MAG: aminotransferase class IV [Isosphaeraceae bacterium]|nr:aminotransferase class IV [Isosphaeraceae bacterium]